MYDREVVHMPDGGCVALDTEVLPASQVGLRALTLALNAVGGGCFIQLGGAAASQAGHQGLGLQAVAASQLARPPSPSPPSPSNMPARLPPCLCTCLQQLPEDAPVLVLLPGLTGGSEDSYVQHAVVSLGTGWRCRWPRQ